MQIQQHWYQKDPELFEAEQKAMSLFFPKFKLDKLEDYRLCWRGTLNLGNCSDTETSWTLMAVYEHNYPNNTSWGCPIKVYSIKPDLNELQSQLGDKWLPQVIRDLNCNHYMSLAHPCPTSGDMNAVISAASSLRQAVKWIFFISQWLKGGIDNSGFAVGNDYTGGGNNIPKQVVFSNRAFTALLAETKEKITTETGGIFLGVMLDDTWYVVETIDPGPKSIFQPAYFEYDGDYVRHLANKVNRLYGDKLDVLGLWHRHPGSMDTFSSTDEGTIKKFAEGNNGVTISAIVNIDTNFRLTMYAATLNPLSYKKIDYEIDDTKIPKEVTNVLFHKDIETKINSKNNERRSPQHKPNLNNFCDILVKHLHTAEHYPVAIGAIFKNSEDDCNTIIDDYLVDEYLFCEEHNIPLAYEKKECNEIELTVGDENYNLKFTFYIPDFSCKDDFIQSTQEIENVKGKHPCFIHNGNLYLYKGNLLKNALGG